MSRTLHVDLTPSRRSKRLLQNGYYLQPPGEQQPQLNEYSSEDDDDNASVHSNNSSIFSGRAVHYSESPGSTVFSHKRRKRKGMESPRSGTLLSQKKSHSPAVKSRLQLAEASTSSRSTPNLSTTVSRQDKVQVSSNRSQTIRESKTTIHSVKQMSQSHRYARGESSSITQSALSTSQTEMRDLTLNASTGEAQSHLGAMTRNQSRYNAIGSGDRLAMNTSAAGEGTSQESISISQEYHADQRVLLDDGNSTRQRKTQSRYSSESDLISDENGILRKFKKDAEFSVPAILTKIWSAVWMLLSAANVFIGNICRTIYQAVLKIFVFDVWWLSRKTSPLLVKVARYVMVFLLLLLLLSSVYLFATRLVDDNAETLLLPVRSIAGFLSSVPSALTSISIFSDVRITKDESTHKSTSESMSGQETESPIAKMHPDIQDIMTKAQLHFAEKLLQIKEELNAMRQEQSKVNKRQQEIQQKISDSTVQQEAADTLLKEKLLALETEISEMRINHTSTGRSLQSDIERLHSLLVDKSQMSVKINEMSARLNAFDSRLDSLNKLMMKSIEGVNQQAGNVTYIKEIAKMQFTENFLQLLKSTEASTVDENSLSFLFIAWLKKQGFAREEEVQQSINTMSVNNNLTLAVLEKKFMTQFERVKHDARRHTSTITLEKIIERPAGGQTEPNKILVEAEMRKWIQQELDVYSADRIGLADHALESAGGFVVSTRCSESYDRKTALVSLFGIPIYYNINTPRSVIQANTLPGECWSFKGAEGYIVIALSGAVRPTSFTLEHIPRELSPYGRIDSAPKDFTVLGLADMYDYEGRVLGKYRYERDGRVIQQYTATTDVKGYFSFIELRVSSNWGHPDYTCLYRFRVHGNRKDLKSPPS